MVERLLRLRCSDCGEEFIVKEREIDDLPLTCPICTAEVDIGEVPDDEDDELEDDEEVDEDKADPEEEPEENESESG